jgi:hypothetical protein
MTSFLCLSLDVCMPRFRGDDEEEVSVIQPEAIPLERGGRAADDGGAENAPVLLGLCQIGKLVCHGVPLPGEFLDLGAALSRGHALGALA